MITRILSLGFAIATMASAQIVPAARRECVWDGSHVIVCDPRARTIYDFTQGGKPPRSLRAPEGSLGLTYGNGAGWTILKSPRPDAKFSWVLWSSHGLNAWAPYGAIQDKTARTIRCYPLDGGLFLLFSTPASPYRIGKRVSTIAIGAMNNAGEIEIRSLVDLGIEGGFLEQSKPQPGTAAPSTFRLKDGFHFLNDLLYADSPFVRFSDGFALVADRTGLIWSFSAKGQLRKMLRLFPSVTNERLLKEEELEHAVLGFQPTDDDRILMATRSETAVLNAMAKFPRNETLEGYKNPNVRKENARQELASVEAYPALEWWSVDCVAGSITRVDPPLKVRDKFDTPAQINEFTFAFFPSGNLFFGDPKDIGLAN